MRFKIFVTFRVEKNGTIAMVYYDHRGDLVFFTMAEGHNTAVYNYYRQDTKPLKNWVDNEEAKKLLFVYSDYDVVVRTRLNRNERIR